MHARYDVAVIGGGPAGSAASVVLGRQRRRTILLDAGSSTEFKIGEALPPVSRRLLRELGVWELFAAGGHLPVYGNESAWGDSLPRYTDFIRDPDGPGWRLDRARFDLMLRDAARQAGAVVLEGTRAAELRRSGAEWTISISGAVRPSDVRAQWLVDCTGRAGWLARQLRIRRTRLDRLVCLYRLYETTSGTDPDSLTLTESVPEGWWYTARLPTRRRLAAFFADAGTPAIRQARVPDGFGALLGRTVHVRSRLDGHRYVSAGVPKSVSADSACLERFAGEGWLAAGDAAISQDPISSQGILTALYSGVHAGRALDAALSGDDGPLAKYPDLIRNVYSAYRRNLAFVYRSEARWPEAEFWRRRGLWG
jgi:flavin-dependent dehydrogenase